MKEEKNENFFIDLHHPIYQAGSRLRGHVFLRCEQENFEAKSLEVYIEGRERVELRYEDKHNLVHHAKSRRPLIDLVLEVTSFQDFLTHNGTLPIGMYAFPFEIQLPPRLPTSFDRDYEYGMIEYVIEATVKGCEYPHQYKALRPLTVCGKPLPEDPLPYKNVLACDMRNPHMKKVSTVFGVGLLMVGVLLRDTLLGRGEVTRFALSCRNRSQFVILHIQIEVMQKMVFKAKGKTEEMDLVLHSFKFGLFDGVERNNKGKHSIKNDLKAINSELEAFAHSFHFTMPKNARETYSGMLIRVRHEIVVSFATNSKKESWPRITIPIRVGAPGMERHKQLKREKPPYWSHTAVARPIRAGNERTVLGGKPVHHDDSKFRQTKKVLVPKKRKASFINLLKDLRESIDPKSLIQEHSSQDGWRDILIQLTPEEFGAILEVLHGSFDEIHVAIYLAEIIEEFSADHLIDGLKHVRDSHRIPFLTKGIPHTHESYKDTTDKLLKSLHSGEEGAVMHVIQCTKIKHKS
eukprot:CAMPEP_0202456868 /NCGR_PEP_ID=MMETSP1360-20130828/14025_1 /ASSEMBLY_ACC=CAM_ASM_000848 /TAXON_ID=515479 /ORGANISM="Licmophora paradoxa, Strain CCMP2313" /LENGTH=519 /DNA_ID=CAMNT_0049076811 /DNA_START=23 /DNA_END=1582 /DNA_ORIENTATION=+